jgi:hypothetical protein
MQRLRRVEGQHPRRGQGRRVCVVEMQVTVADTGRRVRQSVENQWGRLARQPTSQQLVRPRKPTCDLLGACRDPSVPASPITPCPPSQGTTTNTSNLRLIRQHTRFTPRQGRRRLSLQQRTLSMYSSYCCCCCCCCCCLTYSSCCSRSSSRPQGNAPWVGKLTPQLRLFLACFRHATAPVTATATSLSTSTCTHDPHLFGPTIRRSVASSLSTRPQAFLLLL